MMTSIIFENDGSQVVMLPEECRFDSDEIMVYKIGIQFTYAKRRQVGFFFARFRRVFR